MKGAKWETCLSIITTAQTLLTLPGDVIRVQEPIPPYGMLIVKPYWWMHLLSM